MWLWHQDYGYWYGNGCLYPDMLTVAIPLTPMSSANGCLQVVPTTNRMGRIEHLRIGEQTGADPGTRQRDPRLASSPSRSRGCRATCCSSTATHCTGRRQTSPTSHATYCWSPTTRVTTSPTGPIITLGTTRSTSCRIRRSKSAVTFATGNRGRSCRRRPRRVDHEDAPRATGGRNGPESLSCEQPPPLRTCSSTSSLLVRGRVAIRLAAGCGCLGQRSARPRAIWWAGLSLRDRYHGSRPPWPLRGLDPQSGRQDPRPGAERGAVRALPAMGRELPQPLRAGGRARAALGHLDGPGRGLA